ncbi:hypothetical protein [Aureimonas sp. AU20]|nr:hypothetical protein [Aureimonas sp. AU20]
MTGPGRTFALARAKLRNAIDQRWRGHVPLARLLFVDMLVWGTILNLTTTGASLILLAYDAPIWAVIAVWLSSWPCNAFLCLSVWRTADRAKRGVLPVLAGPLATIWALGISVV